MSKYKQGNIVNNSIVLRVYTTNNPQLFYQTRVEVYNLTSKMIESFAITV